MKRYFLRSKQIGWPSLSWFEYQIWKTISIFFNQIICPRLQKWDVVIKSRYILRKVPYWILSFFVASDFLWMVVSKLLVFWMLKLLLHQTSTQCARKKRIQNMHTSCYPTRNIGLIGVFEYLRKRHGTGHTYAHPHPHKHTFTNQTNHVFHFDRKWVFTVSENSLVNYIEYTHRSTQNYRS